MLENMNLENEQTQALTLEDFLTKNAITNKTSKVVLCERLKNYEFEIKILEKDELTKFASISIVRDRKGRVLKEDANKFKELVVLNATVYPDFNNLEFISKCNAKTPGEALNNVLKPGEVEKLSEIILEFNGYSEDFDELRDTAKN